MMGKTNVAVLGGDKRQEYLAQMFAEKFNVKTFGVYEDDDDFGELDNGFDVYIFPMPITKDNVHINTKFEEKQCKLSKIIEKIPPRSIILGGNVTESVKNLFSSKKLEITDYLQSEQLAILNAVPIALGVTTHSFN